MRRGEAKTCTDIHALLRTLPLHCIIVSTHSPPPSFSFPEFPDLEPDQTPTPHSQGRGRGRQRLEIEAEVELSADRDARAKPSTTKTLPQCTHICVRHSVRTPHEPPAKRRTSECADLWRALLRTNPSKPSAVTTPARPLLQGRFLPPPPHPTRGDSRWGSWIDLASRAFPSRRRCSSHSRAEGFGRVRLRGRGRDRGRLAARGGVCVWARSPARARGAAACQGFSASFVLQLLAARKRK